MGCRYSTSAAGQKSGTKSAANSGFSDELVTRSSRAVWYHQKRPLAFLKQAKLVSERVPPRAYYLGRRRI
jgi:hypothetical protein